jgi:hypothetical protein
MAERIPRNHLGDDDPADLVCHTDRQWTARGERASTS